MKDEVTRANRDRTIDPILSPPINKRSDEYGGPLQKGILIAQELEKRGIDEV
jgi:2,4-dienoyl-CoA reductase-like NADH-dependent reductase (Old Yellow Enzyme family)